MQLEHIDWKSQQCLAGKRLETDGTVLECGQTSARETENRSHPVPSTDTGGACSTHPCTGGQRRGPEEPKPVHRSFSAVSARASPLAAHWSPGALRRSSLAARWQHPTPHTRQGHANMFARSGPLATPLIFRSAYLN